ncbi:MAG: CARDB domain-containing protein [Lepagella sp.]
MKKQLLFASSLILAVGSIFAGSINIGPAVKAQKPANDRQLVRSSEEAQEGFINFGYAEAVSSAYSLNGVSSGNVIYLAFEIPVADQADLIGAQITGLNITTGSSDAGTNKITTVNAFVTDDISDRIPTALMTKGTLGTDSYTEYYVALNNPIEITGEKPLYVGYCFSYKNCYYIPVDEVPISATNKTCLVAVASGVTATPEFENYSDQIGSICISARVEGDNLPKDKVTIKDVYAPDYQPFANNSCFYYAKVKNEGSNAIREVTVNTSISNGTTSEKTVTLENPVYPGQTASVELKDIPNNAEGVYTLTSKVVKANGVDIENPTEYETCLASYNDGAAARVPVIEEATGNWCGFCPRGIWMMETLEENFPDWIRIAVHGGSSSEPMLCPTYNSFINTYASGFPYAIVNRALEVQDMSGNVEYYSAINDYYATYESYCGITFTDNTVAEDQKSVHVATTTNFSCDSDIAHMLSFALVEDNVGPYSQTNYYSGGSYGPCGGWEDKDKSVSTIYNDVARYIKSFPGIKNSISEVKKGGQVEYELNLPISTVKGDEFRLVAMVTNSYTGEIVNAKQIKLSKTGAGVNDIMQDAKNVTISVVNGAIVVNGANNVAVYTLDGRRVNANDLNSGVYVVKADGIAKKVMVK